MQRPSILDEKVARLHLAKIRAKLTKVTDKQATYIGIPQEGRFKIDHSRIDQRRQAELTTRVNLSISNSFSRSSPCSLSH